MGPELAAEQRGRLDAPGRTLPEEFVPLQIGGPFQIQESASGEAQQMLCDGDCQIPSFLNEQRDWLAGDVLVVGNYGFALADSEGGGPWVISPAPPGHVSFWRTFPLSTEAPALLRKHFLIRPEVRLLLDSSHMHGGKSHRAAIVTHMAAEEGLFQRGAVFVPASARPESLESGWLLASKRCREEGVEFQRLAAPTPWEALGRAVEEKLDFVVLDETGLWFLDYVRRNKASSEKRDAAGEYEEQFLRSIYHWLSKGHGKLLITHMKALTDLSHWPIHNQLVDLVRKFYYLGIAVYYESYATCCVTGGVAKTSSLTTGIYWYTRPRDSWLTWQIHQLVTDLGRWPKAILPDYLALSPEVDQILRPEIWARAGGLAAVDFPYLSLTRLSPDLYLFL